VEVRGEEELQFVRGADVGDYAVGVGEERWNEAEAEVACGAEEVDAHVWEGWGCVVGGWYWLAGWLLLLLLLLLLSLSDLMGLVLE
jgi:hypothetical protein